MTIPAWVAPLLEQVWSFFAVALFIHALGVVSKRVAERLGWRRYRNRDVHALVRTVQAANADESSGDVVLPADASWYDITLRIHPLIAGVLFGFLPLPTLHVIDSLGKDQDAGPYSLLAARCAWFMLAGAMEGQIYEIVKFAASPPARARILALVGIRIDTPAPSPPPLPKVQITPAEHEHVSDRSDTRPSGPPKTEPTQVVETEIVSGNEDR